MKEQITFNGRNIGFIEGETYYSPRGVKHFMVKFSGFGISKVVLSQLWDKGVQNVVFIYGNMNSRRMYKCPLKEFMESDKRHTNYDEQRLADEQKFVSVEDMKEIK